MPQVFMPRLSDTMQEGTVSVWNKAVGDKVDKGDILAEIETDKATMELEAYDAGILEQILVQPGSTVPIGEIIAIIGDGTGSAAAPAAPAAPKAAPSTPPPATPPPSTPPPSTPPPSTPSPATPAADATAAAAPAAASPAAPTEAAPAAPAAPPAPAPTAAVNGHGSATKASPLARAIARDAGLDLSTVKGSGPGGRIVRADVNDAVAALASTSAPSTSQPAGSPATSSVALGSDDVVVPLNNIRKITARRLVESKQQVPHFYLTRAIDAQDLVEARARINSGLAAVAAATKQDAVKVSVNDLVVKAVATALRAHPEVNVSFAGDTLIRHGRVHVGVAVSLDDGLIVPVLRDTDTLTVSQISVLTKELAGRARAGKLSPAEFTGGTFSISNLGMFGVDEFAAVINPPEAAILAVGAAKDEAVARDGQVVVRQVMRVTLSLDHRAVDGATGAKFLATLASLLENPLAALA